MRASTSFVSDLRQPLFLDSSVVINLNGTGFAGRILAALPLDPVVPEAVMEELEAGAIGEGHSDAEKLKGLVDRKIARRMELDESVKIGFMQLTDRESENSLGDG